MTLGCIVAVVALGQAPAGWTVYTPKAGGFQIALPGQPVEKITTQKAASGPIEVVDVSCQAGGFLYRAERTTMAKPFGKEHEQGALDAIVKSVESKTKLKGAQKIVVQGHPARDLLVEAPLKAGAKPSTIAMRLVVADRDLYQIRVFALTPGTTPKLAGEFFDTFQIKTPSKP